MLFRILIFPGLIFLIASAFLFDWLDRKLIARFQGRVGPPWYQPLADFIKMISKEDILTVGTNPWIASLLPLLSFASVLTAAFYIPISGMSIYGFQGDFIVILFLLSLPSLLYFLAGWISTGVYSVMGGNRSLLQYFAYEVLVLLSFSGAAVASGSWSMNGITAHQTIHGANIFAQPVGFLMAVAGLIGKLKRAPFDIPKAKSEMVAGPLTEFSGKKLAFWYLTIELQTVTGIFLMMACFLGGVFIHRLPVVQIILFIFFAILMQVILSLISAVFARLRIDQLVLLTWRVFIPMALFQIMILVVQ